MNELAASVFTLQNDKPSYFRLTPCPLGLPEEELFAMQALSALNE